jgi:hypothetical protein
MKYIMALSVVAVLSLHASDGLETWLKDGRINGNIKYYYIDTAKDGGNQATTSQHANAIGGQFGYTTGSLYGFKLGATLMGTTGFAMNGNLANNDTSLVARDDGVRLDGGIAIGVHADDAFVVLGEAYGIYNRDNYELWYGRKVIETPLIDAKESARMLPSAVEGTMGSVKLQSGVEFSAGYLSGFKQRASSSYINIVEHALGANTRTITGHDEGYVTPMSIRYKNDSFNIRVYDYYTPDFMNAIYADATFTNKLNSDWSYAAAVQGISETSIGNANSTAAKAIMGGEINAQEFGAKMSATYRDTTVMVAYTHVLSHKDEHDSLVTPWDGTPLFTNMLTANSLFMSDYGKGLQSDSAYMGGTTGVKVGLNQKLDFTGVKGMMAAISYAQYDGSRFIHGSQEDVNGELYYTIGNLSLALKGMWSSHNTALLNTGNNYDPHNTANIKMSDDFTQYRAIANYKF